MYLYTMAKTFNIYCDESCHLENDGKEFMVLGSINSAYNQVKYHTNMIKHLKKKHNFYAEIKWNNVSDSKLRFYEELLDHFFATDLRFRAVVVPKTKINNESFSQDYNTFYYKMYYQLLNHLINTQYTYNVYLDIKDDLSADKVTELKKILNIQFGVFRNIQNIRSHESLLLQLADLIMGAISYNVNIEEKNSKAKIQLIEKIKSHSKQNLDCSSNYGEEKFNLFFIDLK